ncbi:MAG TPA: DNA polymerase III subunit alpha [Mariprofundaceae bacterium]|nr:DNA polymerase III subunit alpha [Mariprofundaceae bacterium]
MQFSPFAHLHVHSDFSLLSGAMPVGKMLDMAAEMKQPAIALTDHGNLFGAVEFYAEAMRRGIKPILGCEVFLCDDHSKRVADGSRQPRYPQLLLLARNNHGWKNLMRLVSIAYLEGFYYKPRVDKQLLRQFGEGLIALSSGWNGEIERLLQQGDREGAARVAWEYTEIFPHHSFFIELQRHGATGQEALSRQLIELAHETDIPLVATNNAHFLKRDDFHAFEAMLALQQNKTLIDDVSGHYTPECYLKSYDDMYELFEDVPEALENSLHIASRCNVDVQFGNYQLPDFQTPDDSDLVEFMRRQAIEGLDARWSTITAGIPDADREVYSQRLDYELGVIEKMGFPGYFLIVADFIGWAKEHDIPVGPGRGSGAGSLVAYVLGITDLDPLRYGLLFERFLNPERVSMPDFDIDFCMSRRDEVIRYVTEKYGAERVAQIITYGSMKAKAVVRDVGRVLGLPYIKVDEVAKLVPNDLNMTLEKAFVSEPRLGKLVKSDADIGRLFDIAQRLEGLHRHAGKHAAGVVIGRSDLVETAPLYRDPREGGAVVQWDMKCAEKVGLVKFDFLGLKTLTVIDLACRLIRKHEGQAAFEIGSIPLDDAATFRLLQRGATSAVFQVESSGMRDLLVRLRPDCFEDIIALVALYRPGPLESGMVEDFINCKHGRQKIAYPLPQLEPILSETNGVILYQEQVMQIAQVLAGYTLGQADMLRRAMGKKKPEEMAKQRKIFMEGAEKNSVPADKAEQIFDLMEKFAGYGFNKSHSAAYALIAYQTAYLKAHFPQAFMAATLSCDMGNSDKVQMLIADCRSMEIDLLPPDINASDWEFVPEGDAIRYGLGAVKGVGEAAVAELVRVREQDDPFTSFEDMYMRMPPRVLNKRMLEALIKSGALHPLIPHPNAALQGLAKVLEDLGRKRREQEARQSALFEVAEPSKDGNIFADAPRWGLGECLQAEREVLGFYLTGHPLEEYLGRVTGMSNTNLSQVCELPDGAKAVLPIGISSVRVHRGAKGAMAFVQIEDLHASAEMVCFAKLYGAVAEYLDGDQALLAAVRVDRSRGELSLIAEDIVPLETVLPELVQRVCIVTSAVSWDAEMVDNCRQLISEHPGTATLAFHVRMADGSMAELASPLGVQWNTEVRQRLESWFGVDALQLQCRPWQPGQHVAGSKQEERVQHAA